MQAPGPGLARWLLMGKDEMLGGEDGILIPQSTPASLTGKADGLTLPPTSPR